ncbi:MAG: hypothetical protein R3E12_05825 [Candidatus Eisenbacteria bacterium]
MERVGRRALLDQLGVTTLDGFECDDLEPALGAAGALLEYVREQKQSTLGHLRQVRRLRVDDGLLLDETTLRSLELLEPMPGGHRDSTLIAALDATVTAAGGRHLRATLRRPFTDRRRIERRLDAVEALLESARRERLRTSLKATADLERILARLHCGRTVPRDLGGLRATLRQLPALERLGSEVAAGLASIASAELEPLRTLEAALDDSLSATLTEGGIFRAAWNGELAETRGLARDAKSWIAKLQETERARTES